MNARITTKQFEDIDIGIKQSPENADFFHLYIHRESKTNTSLKIEHIKTECKRCKDDFIIFMCDIPYCIGCENIREDLQEELANKSS